MELDRTLIANALINADIPLEEVRWNYVGRGMYGTTCFGFTVDGNHLTAFGRFLVQIALLSDDGDEGADRADYLADHAATDDMGLGTVVYFPGVKIANAEDDE